MTPEDAIVDVEEREESIDDSFVAAFDEEDETPGEEGTPAEPDEADAVEDGEEEPGEAEKPPAGGEEQEDDSPKSALDQLLAWKKESEDKSRQEQPDGPFQNQQPPNQPAQGQQAQPPSQAHQEQHPQQHTQPRKLTKEYVAAVDQLWDEKELFPDDVIRVGDKEYDFKEFSEYNPEMVQFIKLGSALTAERLLGNLTRRGVLPTGQHITSMQQHVQDLQQNMQNMQNEIQELHFWDAVSREVPEAPSLRRDAAFLGWLEKDEKVLHEANETKDPKQMAMIFNAYKESIAAAAAADHDRAAGEKKKQRDDLHGGTLRGGSRKSGSRTGSGLSPDEEFREAFYADD